MNNRHAKANKREYFEQIWRTKEQIENKHGVSWLKKKYEYVRCNQNQKFIKTFISIEKKRFFKMKKKLYTVMKWILLHSKCRMLLNK